jgi:glutathione reductase (NADPH)
MASGRRAAALGKTVCMIENRRIGGTCVNVGCVPKKVMFNLANFLEEAHAMKGYGVGGTEGLTLDFAAFKAKRDGYVLKLNGIYERNVSNANIRYVKGTATFVSDKVVKVGDQLF